MAKIETLTAYNCRFGYLHRNNPMIKEQRNAIKKKEKPPFNLSDFINVYVQYAKTLATGENTDRAIMTTEKQVFPFSLDGSKCWHLTFCAGKQGRPFTIVKKSELKKYDFGTNSVALYDHHVFFYENNKNIVMIFHRQNGSGCKSVFLETANKLLKEKGIKLEMDVIMPFEDKFSEAIPLKITLQCTEKRLSSDIAENIQGPKRKMHVFRELGLSLKSTQNSKFSEIIEDFRLGKIKQDVAFARIKAEAKDCVDYDTAEVRLKIGKHIKNCPWDALEKMFGNYDISAELHDLYKITGNFTDSLKTLSNKYYQSIVSSGVLDNE